MQLRRVAARPAAHSRDGGSCRGGGGSGDGARCIVRGTSVHRGGTGRLRRASARADVASAAPRKASANAAPSARGGNNPNDYPRAHGIDAKPPICDPNDRFGIRRGRRRSAPCRPRARRRSTVGDHPRSTGSARTRHRTDAKTAAPCHGQPRLLGARRRAWAARPPARFGRAPGAPAARPGRPPHTHLRTWPSRVGHGRAHTWDLVTTADRPHSCTNHPRADRRHGSPLRTGGSATGRPARHKTTQLTVTEGPRQPLVARASVPGGGVAGRAARAATLPGRPPRPRPRRPSAAAVGAP